MDGAVAVWIQVVDQRVHQYGCRYRIPLMLTFSNDWRHEVVPDSEPASVKDHLQSRWLLLSSFEA